MLSKEKYYEVIIGGSVHFIRCSFAVYHNSTRSWESSRLLCIVVFITIATIRRSQSDATIVPVITMGGVAQFVLVVHSIWQRPETVTIGQPMKYFSEQ